MFTQIEYIGSVKIMQKSESRVYLDHAATTAVRPEVIDTVTDVLKNHYGNPSSFYLEGHESAKILENSRKIVSQALNADPKEIYFTSCGTEADNWAVKGTAFAKKEQGKHIISSKIEHHAVLHSLDWLAKQGFEIQLLDVDEYGRVNPDDLRAAIRPDTILVTIMMANNEVGTIQPIAELGKICREHKVLFHTDAVQAFGAIPIDVEAMNIDLLSLSGHKLYAPKGVGALYMRKGVRIESLIHGGAQEMRKRAGTENLPYIAGLAKAVELAMSEMEENRERLIEMREYLKDEILKSIPHSKLNGHPEERLPNNLNFSFEFIEGESILLMLDALGYDCSSGSACTSASLDPSHVLLAMGMPHEIAHGSLRVTFGKENTMADIEKFARELPPVIERLRMMSPLWEDFRHGKIDALIP